jgi:hypothetical protein
MNRIKSYFDTDASIQLVVIAVVLVLAFIVDWSLC